MYHIFIFLTHPSIHPVLLPNPPLPLVIHPLLVHHKVQPPSLAANHHKCYERCVSADNTTGNNWLWDCSWVTATATVLVVVVVVVNVGRLNDKYLADIITCTQGCFSN